MLRTQLYPDIVNIFSLDMFLYENLLHACTITARTQSRRGMQQYKSNCFLKAWRADLPGLEQIPINMAQIQGSIILHTDPQYDLSSPTTVSVAALLKERQHGLVVLVAARDVV